MRLAVLLPLGVLVLLAGSARAARVTYSTGPFAVYCTSSGQLCDPPETLTVVATAPRARITRIEYDAPDAHCSSGRLHVAVDGREVARMRYVAARERTTLRRRINLRAGTHVFAFRFEGRTGGCNVGAVVSWGGTITLVGRG